MAQKEAADKPSNVGAGASLFAPTTMRVFWTCFEKVLGAFGPIPFSGFSLLLPQKQSKLDC